MKSNAIWNKYGVVRPTNNRLVIINNYIAKKYTNSLITVSKKWFY